MANRPAFHEESSFRLSSWRQASSPRIQNPPDTSTDA